MANHEDMDAGEIYRRIRSFQINKGLSDDELRAVLAALLEKDSSTVH